MGMYDTIQLTEAVECNHCKRKFLTVQTKMFENMMDYYIQGDKVSTKTSFMVFPKNIYCDCEESRNVSQQVHIVIYEGKYIYSSEDLQKAKWVANSPQEIIQTLNSKRLDYQNMLTNSLNRMSSTVQKWLGYLKDSEDKKNSESLNGNSKWLVDYYQEPREMGIDFLKVKHEEILSLFKHQYFDLFFPLLNYDEWKSALPNPLLKGMFDD